jgi:hypothetical protein
VPDAEEFLVFCLGADHGVHRIRQKMVGQVAEIVLQFSAQDDLGSKLIRAFSHGPYSHVDAVLPDGTLLGSRNDVINGIQSGVQIRPKDYAQFSAIKVVRLPTTPECTQAFYDAWRGEIGKPYDETAILGFVADRNWRDPNGWFCAEGIAAKLEKPSDYFSFSLAAPANKITPADLLLALSATANVGETQG